MTKWHFTDIAAVYGLTALVFLVVDFLWLGVFAKEFYARHLGSFLRDQVNWTAALLFYTIYIGGMCLFVVGPALAEGTSITRTLVFGALLGLFAYSTFDLTNLALVRNWPPAVVVVDIIWGTVLTALTSALVVWLTRAVLKIDRFM